MYKKEIKIGQTVYNSLYGGKYGYVYKIHGEQSPDTCEDMSGIVVTGGSAYFDIVWDNKTISNRTPESLVRSSGQWKVFDKYINETDLAEMLKVAENKNQIMKEAQNESYYAPPESKPEIENKQLSEGVEIASYKGNPTIKLPMGSRSFCFGLSKAKTILEHLDDIRQFVTQNTLEKTIS